MSVSYEYYKIFYHVAKCKSFNKAAAALFNSQPNITRAINNLERELDCKLFIRSHKGVELTPEGKELYQHVSVAHHQIELAENMLTTIHDFKSGSVSIGMSFDVSEIFIHDKLLPVVEAFHRDYPDIHLQTTLDTTSNIVADMSNNTYDIAFVTDEVNFHTYPDEQTLVEFRDLVVVGRKFSELCSKKVSFEELSAYPIISLWSQTETYETYKRFFEKNNATFAPQLELASKELVKIFAEGDFGVAFLSPKTVAGSIRNKKLFKIELEKDTPVRCSKILASEKGKRNRAAMKLRDEFAKISVHII